MSVGGNLLALALRNRHLEGMLESIEPWEGEGIFDHDPNAKLKVRTADGVHHLPYPSMETLDDLKSKIGSPIRYDLHVGEQAGGRCEYPIYSVECQLSVKAGESASWEKIGQPEIGYANATVIGVAVAAYFLTPREP